LDADKEGFLRSARSLTQTVGRAARNVNGKAIMYADKITASMQKTIDETNYRREKQTRFNEAHGLKPEALNKAIQNSTLGKSNATKDIDRLYQETELLRIAAEPKAEYLENVDLEKVIKQKKKAMEKAAKDLDFMQAAKLRDEIKIIQEKINKNK